MLKEKLPVGTEFFFQCKVKGDGGKIDELKGQKFELFKSILEGEFGFAPSWRSCVGFCHPRHGTFTTFTNTPESAAKPESIIHLVGSTSAAKDA